MNAYFGRKVARREDPDLLTGSALFEILLSARSAREECGKGESTN